MTIAAVLIALIVTGVVSAGLGGAPEQRAVVRNVIGGRAGAGDHIRHRSSRLRRYPLKKPKP